MSNTENTRASLEELQTALPQAGADFWVAQYNAASSIGEAVANYATHLAAENTRLQAEIESSKTTHAAAIETARAEATAAAAATPPAGSGLGNSAALGALPPGEITDNYAGATGDAEIDYDTAVRVLTARGMDRRKASSQVARRNPELFQAFLLATNTGRKSQRLVMEKLDLEAELANN